MTLQFPPKVLVYVLLSASDKCPQCPLFPVMLESFNVYLVLYITYEMGFLLLSCGRVEKCEKWKNMEQHVGNCEHVRGNCRKVW